jgi:diguanylate cyclase
LPVLDASPYPEFDAAAHAALGHLRDRLGLGYWAIARRHTDGFHVLYQAGHHGGLTPGARIGWSDLCTALVDGEGPPVAPVVAEVPAYARALTNAGALGDYRFGHEAPNAVVPEAVGPEPFSGRTGGVAVTGFGGATTQVLETPTQVREQVRVGAFIGVPILVEDGAMFGVLCGVDATPHPPELAAELPLLEVMARLLGTILAAELRADDTARQAERAETGGVRDELTGLANRQGWDRVLRAEEARAKRYGSPAAIVSIDLEGLDRAADDEAVMLAARTVVAATRDSDIVARLSGAELAVLAVECDDRALEALVRRLEDQLGAAGVPAVVGAAVRTPGGTLEQAWLRADAAVSSRSAHRTPVV